VISESVTDCIVHSSVHTVTVGSTFVSKPVPVMVMRDPPPKLPVVGEMEDAVSSDV